MNQENISMESQERWKPAPAESFGIEFMNAQAEKISRALGSLGFVIRKAYPEGEDVIVYQGERSLDGTKIELRITKGENYKSPAELAKEAGK